MPTLHKVILTDEITATEVQAEFLRENCPEHGQMGQAGAYYINDEVLEDLKKAIQPNQSELKAFILLLEPIIKAEGLYEFYLED